MEQKISKAEIRYGDTNQGFVTMRAMRNEAGGMDITIIDAFFRTDTGEEIPAIIADFKIRVAMSGNISQTDEKISEKRENISEKRENISEKPKSLRKTRTLFTDEQKADIIRRYKAGEGPKAIAESLNCARSTIGLIIKNAGAVEGRRGAHLNKPKPEPQPEADENEPV